MDVFRPPSFWKDPQKYVCVECLKDTVGLMLKALFHNNLTDARIESSDLENLSDIQAKDTFQKSKIDTKNCHFKGSYLFQTIILGIHVSLRGCKSFLLGIHSRGTKKMFKTSLSIESKTVLPTSFGWFLWESLNTLQVDCAEGLGLNSNHRDSHRRKLYGNSPVAEQISIFVCMQPIYHSSLISIHFIALDTKVIHQL